MSKIKAFFGKIFAQIAEFFAALFDKIGQTKFMKKLGYYLSYIPNKIAG